MFIPHPEISPCTASAADIQTSIERGFGQSSLILQTLEAIKHRTGGHPSLIASDTHKDPGADVNDDDDSKSNLHTYEVTSHSYNETDEQVRQEKVVAKEAFQNFLSQVAGAERVTQSNRPEANNGEHGSQQQQQEQQGHVVSSDGPRDVTGSEEKSGGRGGLGDAWQQLQRQMQEMNNTFKVRRLLFLNKCQEV